MSGDAAQLLRCSTQASVAVAILLVVVKAYAWWQTGSVAVLASLVDSLMDAVASVINLAAVAYALTPPDRAHRFGHGKAEALAGLGQGLLILCSALFLVAESVSRLLEPSPPEQVMIGVGAMLFCLGMTAALVMYQHHVITKTRSTAIRADALHYRMDLLSGAAVLIVLAISDSGPAWLDPMLALAIAGYTLLAVGSVFRLAFNELLDRELPQDLRDQILSAVRAHPRVDGCHDLRTRRAGRTLFIELHLELDGGLSLSQAHTIADEVAEALRDRWPDADVVVHQDPTGHAERTRDHLIESSGH